MPLPVITAVLLGALLHAAWNACIRAATDKYLTTVLVAGGAGAITTCFLPFLPVPAAASWPYLSASVFIHVLYFQVMARLYRRTDLSLAYPLMRGSVPALSAIVAVPLVHESPSCHGWAGVVLVSLGIMVLTAEAWRSGALNISSVLLAFVNGGIIVVYTLVDGVGVRISGHPVSYTGWLFFLTAIPLILIYCARRGWKGVTDIRRKSGMALLGGACSVGSYGVALWAMTHSPLALVAALREISVIFGTVIAAGFLGERVSFLRYVAIFVVICGALYIKIA